ncbi:hypothetical protein AB0H88_08010 [Nonomuraea sp. NPDC050680]|uniref:hypothetical protein n=1 Tax=Nonomuraea sp. NPDC050680 TaxID=3154630 RepID=UPI003409B2CF
MVEYAEVDVAPTKELSWNERRDNFQFAVSLLDLALEHGGMSACYSAYWMVRLAAVALRYGGHVQALPQVLTPNGVAQLVLERLPLSRDEALAEAGRRRTEPEGGVDRVHIPGEDLSVGPSPLDQRFRSLADIESVLPALTWVAGGISDEWLASEVRSWLDLLPRLMDEAE